jgi:hypothetical protein
MESPGMEKEMVEMGCSSIIVVSSQEKGAGLLCPLLCIKNFCA